MKQLLVLKLVRSDDLLTSWGHQPVNELLSGYCLDERMLLWVNENHAILIYKFRISLHKNLQPPSIIKGDPGATIAERIGLHGRSGVQGRPHALTQFAIPLPAGLRHVHAGGLPDFQLLAMGTTVIAARGK